MKEFNNNPYEIQKVLLESAATAEGIGLWQLNLQTRHVSFSSSAYAIIKREPEKMEHSMSFLISEIINEDYKDRMYDAIDISVSSGEFEPNEFKIDYPDGGSGWILINGKTYSNEKDEVVQLMGTMTDITQYKNAVEKIEETANFLDTLMHTIINPIFYKDNIGVYRYCNDAFCEYLGLSRDKIIGHTVYDIAPKNLAEIYHRADIDLMNSRKNQVYEAQVKYSDGNLHDVIFHKSVNTDSKGKVLGLVGIMIDITNQNKNERLMTCLNSAKDIIIDIIKEITNIENIELFYNVLIENLLKKRNLSKCGSVFEIKNDTIRLLSLYGDQCDINVGDEIPSEKSLLMKLLNDSPESPGIINNPENYSHYGYAELEALIPNNDIFSISYIPVWINENKKVLIAFSNSNEIIYPENENITNEYLQSQIPIVWKIAFLNSETLRLSRRDSLTGLMNRNYFNIVFEDRLKLAQRNNEKLTLAVFDLDKLKEINDIFGHAAGDKYITSFSEFIKKGFRNSDNFARIGGDEFCAIFCASSPESLKIKIFEEQKKFSAKNIVSEKNNFFGRFSFGFAVFPQDGNTIDELMNFADKRMYEDKKRGNMIF